MHLAWKDQSYEGTVYFMEWSLGAEPWSKVLECNFGAKNGARYQGQAWL